jgi:hypothetical protein
MSWDRAALTASSECARGRASPVRAIFLPCKRYAESGWQPGGHGNGYSGRAPDGSFVYDGLRRMAESPVVRVAKSTLVISTRTAGPCLGDSGGPQLAGNTVLSLTSAGSKDCTGRAEAYRLDTPAARAPRGLRLIAVSRVSPVRTAPAIRPRSSRA